MIKLKRQILSLCFVTVFHLLHGVEASAIKKLNTCVYQKSSLTLLVHTSIQFSKTYHL